jgi:xanthine dehydrogenase large subunit
MKHGSAREHVTGEAVYVADFLTPKGTLVAAIVSSPHAHAEIVSRDATLARQQPGIVGVFFAHDIPGSNLIGPIVHDEPLLAETHVFCTGQAVALVVGHTPEACRLAADKVVVNYAPLETVLSIEAAIASESFLTTPHTIARGEVEGALKGAAIRIQGEAHNGAQNHFYLETQAAVCIPEERGQMRVLSSTQHPTEMQRMVASVLGVPHHQVVCEVPRMGGGFGGKESQSTNYGCLAALASHHTGRPVKVVLDRDEDMAMTGNRHPFWSRYDAGFDETGRIVALDVAIYSDGGWVADLSTAIMDRALFHLDNAYSIPALRFVGQVCRTNLPSNTAFRGFGGPQGMLVIEEVMNQAADRLGLDPAYVRRRNMYGENTGFLTPYGQVLTEVRLDRIWEELMTSSAYVQRRKDIEAFNASSTFLKRGIGFQPIKFGISFTNALLNQAGALVLVYADGSIQLNHGGTEMGQGLHTKMRSVCAGVFGVDVGAVRVMTTSTDKVPNTSPTAASSGSDLNGQAVRLASESVRERMKAVAAGLLEQPVEADWIFDGGRVFVRDQPDVSLSFSELASHSWLARVSLSATGFYATPGIAYDRDAGRGTPFFYYAYGGSVVEVEVNTLTGEHRMVRADILHDVGNPLLPDIDRGQVEGAFVQGLGWLTCEEVIYDDDGRLITHGPSTYKIPTCGDVPLDFRVALLDRAPQPNVIGGSKAVGEPPFMLALAVLTALRQALSVGQPVKLGVPATPEAILRAIHGL